VAQRRCDARACSTLDWEEAAAMGSEIFERNAYQMLGVATDVPTAEVKSAFAQAQRARRADPKRLADARDILGKFARRLSLDVFVLKPPVPDAVLEGLVATNDLALEPPPVDAVDALLVVPTVELAFGQGTLALKTHAELARSEPVLSPRIER
jgi:hypothetical protein